MADRGPAPPEAVVITGPTASGKTRLSVELARRIGAEIISMDSRQIYRGMDIGTAKPSLVARGCVPHFGFDVVNPDERYSAGRFARDARRWIDAIRDRGRIPLLVGGTGFFLRALVEPMFEEPPLDQERRDRLRAFLGTVATPRLRDWVRALEPDYELGEWMGGGRQRLARRIEVALMTGRALAWWQTHAPPSAPPVKTIVFLMDADRARLVRAIDGRVLDMVNSGLPGEVRSLVEAGYGADAPGMNATGYAEFIPHIVGSRTLGEAIALTQAATRRYARRQVTWFRNQLPDAIRLDTSLPDIELVEMINRTMKGAGF